MLVLESSAPSFSRKWASRDAEPLDGERIVAPVRRDAVNALIALYFIKLIWLSGSLFSDSAVHLLPTFGLLTCSN